MSEDVLNQDSPKDEKQPAAKGKEQGKPSEIPPSDIAQDIRQNAGNNDNTNSMVTTEKNSYR